MALREAIGRWWRLQLDTARMWAGGGEAPRRAAMQITEQGSDHAIIERGGEAEALLSNPILLEAFAKLEEHYVAALIASAVDQAADRERIYTAIRMLHAVRANLQVAVTRGRLTRDNLESVAPRRRA